VKSLVCKVAWCLDLATRYGVCPLHRKHPLKNEIEGRDAFFARLREEGIGAEERKRRRTPQMRKVRLFDDDAPAEPGVAKPFAWGK
jgi:hypothetical protein